MIVVCYGMPRSASTYIWQITFELIHNKYHQYDIKDYLPPEIKDDFIYDVHDAIPQLLEHLPHDFMYLIKTHGPFHPELREYEKKGLIKVICCYRNPYDLVLSWHEVVKKEQSRPADKQRIGFTEVECYEDILHRVDRDVTWCMEWLSGLEDALEFQYKYTKRSHKKNIQKIAAFLGIEDYNLSAIVQFFKNKENILEYNKGESGRGKPINGLEYPGYSIHFQDFINKYFL